MDEGGASERSLGGGPPAIGRVILHPENRSFALFFGGGKQNVNQHEQIEKKTKHALYFTRVSNGVKCHYNDNILTFSFTIVNFLSKITVLHKYKTNDTDI